MTRLHLLRQAIGVIATAIAVATFLLWPLSYASYDRVNLPLRVVHHAVVGWARGDIVVQVVTGYGLFIDGHFWRDHHSAGTSFGRGGGDPQGLTDLSFSHYTLDLSSDTRRPRPFNAYTLHLPLWLVAVPAATVSYLCLRRRRPSPQGFEVSRGKP